MAEDVGGVILAAGYSSRAGMYKMTCTLNGKAAIERCVESMAAVCGEIVVVGGYRIDMLEYLPAKYGRLRLVRNDEYPKGMLSSVCKGLSESSCARVFVTPGDCPLIPPSVYEKLLCAEGGAVVPAFRGKTGHPVLLGRAAAGALLGGGHESLRSFLHTYGYSTVEVGDRGITIDLDTPGDYRAVSALIRRKEAGENGEHRNGPDRQRQDVPPGAAPP